MIATIIILVLTTVITLVFVLSLLRAGKYDQFIEPLDEKNFPLKSLYGVGFGLLELVKFSYDNKNAVKLRRAMVVLYGDKYSDYYVRVFYAQRVSLALTMWVAMSMLACLAGGDDILVLFGLGVVVAAVIYYYFMQQSYTTIATLSQRYISVFPSVVSTLALLVSAGMVLREAWDLVAYSDGSEMHKQMQKVSEDRNNGMAESDALSAMAKRCATPEISKFVSMVIQGLDKGSSDLAYTLREQSDQMWDLKQQKLLQEGEKASGKLLIPIMIMFIGILIMIMMPIMSNLGI